MEKPKTLITVASALREQKLAGPLREQRLVGSRGSRGLWVSEAHRPDGLTESVNSRFSKKPCLKIKGEEQPSKLSGVTLWTLCAYVHTCAHVYTQVST